MLKYFGILKYFNTINILSKTTPSKLNSFTIKE